MKRLALLSVLTVFVLSIASIAFAQQASVFGNNVLVRAFIADTVCSDAPTQACLKDADCASGTCGPAQSSTYSAYLEVRDAYGAILPANEVTVSGIPPTPTPSDLSVNPFLIHNVDLLNNDITMSYDDASKTFYVFCTDGSGLHVMTYGIGLNIPISGQCGSAATQSSYQAPNTNLCGQGTASTVSDGGSNWTWTCYGNGIAGATDATCSTYKKVDGVCGSDNGQTLASAPTNLCVAGTPSTVSGSGPWTWTCTNLYGGLDANCSAQSSQTGHTVDLTITSFSGPSAAYWGGLWSSLLTVANRGTQSASSFTVKYYQGSTSGTYLGSVAVNGLAAGASVNVAYAPRLYIAAHVWSYVTAVVVPNALDTDSNASNNTSVRYVTGN